jgi:hypothetical protein
MPSLVILITIFACSKLISKIVKPEILTAFILEIATFQNVSFLFIKYGHALHFYCLHLSYEPQALYDIVSISKCCLVDLIYFLKHMRIVDFKRVCFELMHDS